MSSLPRSPDPTLVRDVLARIVAAGDSILVGIPEDAVEILHDLEGELVDVLHDLERAA